MADTFWKFSSSFCKQDEIYQLSVLLDVPLYAAGALVALLFAWGAEKATDSGCINDFTDKAIENACLWKGCTGELVAAFHKAGILAGDLKERSEDEPLSIAAWGCVAQDLIKKRADSRNRKRKQRERERAEANEFTLPVTRDGLRDVTPLKKIEERMKMVEPENAHSAARPDFNTLEAYAANNLQTLSPGNMQELAAFKDDLSDDMIRHAIDEACAAGKRTFSYVRRILQRYVDRGFNNLGDVFAEENARRSSQQKRAVGGSLEWGD